MYLKNKIFTSVLIAMVYCIYPANLIHSQEESTKGYNFIPGTVITNSNKVITGFIAKDFYQGFVKCYFKKKLNDEKATVFLPGEISGYRFKDNGNMFISKEVTTESDTRLYFLEQLIKGKANVYFLRDGLEHYYIEKDTSNMMELTETDIYLTNSKGLRYKKPASYTGKLKYMLADCPVLFDRIDNLKLEHIELIRLIYDYNQMVGEKGPNIIYEYSLRPVVMHLGIEGGIVYNVMGYNAVSTNFSPGYEIGCKFDFENFLPNADRTILQTGLYFQRFSGYTFYTREHGVLSSGMIYNNYKVDKLDIKLMAIKIPVTYNYFILTGKVKPYIGAGLINMFLFNQSQNLSIMRFIQSYDSNPLPAWNVGIVGNAGVKIMMKNKHSMSFSLNYEYLGNLNSNPLFGLHNKNLSILAGYSL